MRADDVLVMGQCGDDSELAAGHLQRDVLAGEEGSADVLDGVEVV